MNDDDAVCRKCGKAGTLFRQPFADEVGEALICRDCTRATLERLFGNHDDADLAVTGLEGAGVLRDLYERVFGKRKKR